MAWIPMYLLDKDVEFLNDWLNQEEEIAFLVSNGHKRWIAKKEHNVSADIGTQLIGDGYALGMPNYVEYYLWHIPSGQLPLLGDSGGTATLKLTREHWEKDGKVIDPWSGWTER